MTPPDATRPRIARVFEKVAGNPSFDTHEHLSDDETKDRVLRYLNSGPIVLRTTGRTDDVVDPSRGKVVPVSFRTDGTWIWTDSVAYYLGSYGFGPEPELLAHIRGQGYVCHPPTEEQLIAADDVLQERMRAGRQR
ncbi:hypothetical protein [Frankia sp. AgB32]|uniref:hypothetical protein n=1 Tax=Frankia sp. AgB32 TaxID=631119 RepID=UPI0020102ACB|nr:hypothetical protein [Frankia sp. AgB32]MCK9897130.1 hypothetical protein [Frankia sp. AgB32]